MATLEMVEKLRQMANVSYDEARNALEVCGDDLLEAVIYLERMGKIPPQNGGYYSSKMTVSSQPPKKEPKPPKGESFSSMLNRFLRWCGKIVHKGNTNSFEVWRNNQRLFALPITVLVILAVFCFWLIIILFILGLVFDFRYYFKGPEVDGLGVNDVMDSAAETAQQVKHEVMGGAERYRQQRKQETDSSNYPNEE